MPEMSDHFVAYRDVGEEREQAFMFLPIARYKVNRVAREDPLGVAANFALFSNLSGIIRFVRNQSELA